MSHDNTNKGIISKNDRKSQDNHPDITGSINVDGREYFINGWRKTRNSDGAPFYSLAVKPKAERAAEIRRDYDNRQGSYGSQPDDYDDSSDIPF